MFGRGGWRRRSQTAACAAATDVVARRIRRADRGISFASRPGTSPTGRRREAAGAIAQRSFVRSFCRWPFLEILAAEEISLAEGVEEGCSQRLPAEACRPRPQGQQETVRDDGRRLGNRRGAGDRRPDVRRLFAAEQSRRDVAEGPSGLSRGRLCRGRRSVRLICEAFPQRLAGQPGDCQGGDCADTSDGEGRGAGQGREDGRERPSHDSCKTHFARPSPNWACC